MAAECKEGERSTGHEEMVEAENEPQADGKKADNRGDGGRQERPATAPPNGAQRRRAVSTGNGATEYKGIFTPFRALGHVANEIPFAVQAMGSEHFLATSVGNAFHVYETGKLGLVLVGPFSESPITALVTSGELTYFASGAEIVCCRRAKEIMRFNAGSLVFSLTLFGEHLITLTEDNAMRLWHRANGELYAEVEFPDSFTAGTIVHPSTYLNKVLVSSREGGMQLWNIRTNKIVYEFSRFPTAVTSLVQSPVIDVIAVGLLDGSIILHNIKVDETIMTLHQEGRVTAVSFRTDDQHVMATANAQGDVALWDLEKRQLRHLIQGAHDALIPSLHFVQGQPLLITSGADNAVKEWIFDSQDGGARLLKMRGGHHAPPTLVRFYGEDGTTILSAARDRSLRSFSVVRDQQSFEISQGSLAKKAKSYNVKMDELKLPQITHFSANPAKQKDWDNIITIHAGVGVGRTWSFQRKALGKHLLKMTDNTIPRTTAISACGNFVFMGSVNGLIDMFNIQSGLHRRTFGGTDGHKKSVTGICSDSVYQMVASSSLDGMLKIWEFATGKVVHNIDLESPIAGLAYHSETGMLAAACDDLCIRVVDSETAKVVREFWGHTNRILDMTFSPDGRWLVSAGMESAVRTWDLPTGNMIDRFTVASMPTSLSFSVTGDFLATTHVDSVGIFLWSNRSQYANMSLRSVAGEEEVKERPVALSSTFGFREEDQDGDMLSETNAAKPDEAQKMASARPVSEGLISLSTTARSKWQNLLNLDTIKKRNKPKDPPKAPEKAPFFLATLPGTQPRFIAQDSGNTRPNGEARSKELPAGSTMEVQTEFTRLLVVGRRKWDYREFVDYCRTLNPSAMDLELRSLNLRDEFRDLISFLEAVRWMLDSNRDFELAEAYLAVFLRIYGDVIAENPTVFVDRLRVLRVTHGRQWKRLEELMHFGLCVVDFVKT